MSEFKFVKLAAYDFFNASRDERELECVARVTSDVTVVCRMPINGMEPLTGTRNGFPIVCFDSCQKYSKKMFNHIATTFKWRKGLRSLRADCVSCHDMSALTIGWVSTWFAREKPVLIYDAHEFELGRQSDLKRSSVLNKVIFHLERFLMEKCAFTIVVNDSIADRMVEAYGLDVRPVVVRNIPHFWELDAEKTARKREEFLRALRAPSDAFIVMYHGGVARGRGIENLVSAVAADKCIYSVILGNGEEGYLRSLRDLAREKGVEDRIHFTPAVPIDELRHSVSAADCGVSILEPTCENHRMALPNKFFECIQSETPIVVSDFPEMGRIVRDRGIGLACDPSDVDALVAAFERLRTDRELYACCKRNLKQAKKELCWEKEREPLEKAYASVSKTLLQRKKEHR